MQNCKVRTTSTPFEIKENRRLCWYASTFDQPYTVYDYIPHLQKFGTFEEVVKRGAFTKSVTDPTNDIEANVDHDSRRRFAMKNTGELLLQEDPKGLWASVYLPVNELGDSIIRDVESGVIAGASFRAIIPPGGDVWESGRCVVVQSVLKDVCVTAKPANPNTEVKLRTAAYNYWLTQLKICVAKNKYRV